MAALRVPPYLRFRWYYCRCGRITLPQSLKKRYYASIQSKLKPELEGNGTNASCPQKLPLIHELRMRGLISSMTNEGGLEQALEKGKITAYCGVDPTAGSLHLGNLMTLMPLVHLYARGHTIIPLVGGFTCKIGDPSGRASDRAKMSSQTAEYNIEKIRTQLQDLFLNVSKYVVLHGYKGSALGRFEILDNQVWWEGMTISDFLEGIAQHMRLGPMLARESVKLRLQSPDGIDAASFLYQSLQAYDFCHLFQLRKCQLQVGGSDQWGNITAGIDLFQKLSPKDSKLDLFGLTVPLLLSPSGEKLGKSAGNAMFLDSERTHPFDLYQYFLRTLDEHAEQYLKIFTLLPLERIAMIMQEHVKAPEKRLAQRTLAEELVTLLHSSNVAEKCIFQTAALYPIPTVSAEGSRRDFRSESVLRAFRGDDTMLKRLSISSITSLNLPRLLKSVGLTSSNSEGFRAIENGGVYINGIQERNVAKLIDNSFLIDDKVMVVRYGRSNFRIIEVVSGEEGLKTDVDAEDG